MGDLIWLLEVQMRRNELYFPLSHGVPRVGDRRIIGGIIFVIRNGLRWRDALAEYSPPKTVSSAGAGWVCSTISWRVWRPKAASRHADDRRHPSESAPYGRQSAKKGLFPTYRAQPKAA